MLFTGTLHSLCELSSSLAIPYHHIYATLINKLYFHWNSSQKHYYIFRQVDYSTLSYKMSCNRMLFGKSVGTLKTTWVWDLSPFPAAAWVQLYIPANPFHSHDIVSVHFIHFYCTEICDKLNRDLAMLTFIYLNVDDCWLTSFMP